MSIVFGHWVLQVATCISCGGIFNNHLVANFNLPVEKVWKSVKVWCSYCREFLWNAVYIETHKLSPRDRRDDMSPADGSSTHSGSTSVRGRVHSPHITKLQAARVHAYSLGQLRHGRNRRTDSQTDGLRYRLISPYGGGIKIWSRLVLRPKF